MTNEQKKGGLLGGIVDAVTARDEVAALQAAKKEAEAAQQEAAAARAQANQELAKRQEAEVRANKAEAELRAATIARQEAETKAKAAELQRQTAEARAQAAEAKVKELEAALARLQQELEAARVRTYVVKAGDSLSKIAQQFYGDAKRWPEIYEANKNQIKDPNLIYPGQELRIP